MNNIRHEILELLQAGEKLVLATVVRTAGSTPQKPGSSALFGEKGLVTGTVGGGLLESEVRQICDHALISGISGRYYFSLDSEEDGEGAICGGEAEVLVDANPLASLGVLKVIDRSLSERKGGVLLTVTVPAGDNGMFIERFWVGLQDRHGRPNKLDPRIWHAAAQNLDGIRDTGFNEISLSASPSPATRLYMEKFNPLPRLIIAGAGHVGRALSHLASLLDFEITVVDDRKEFACAGNIPDGDRFVVDQIDNALRSLILDENTYVAILTRGHKYDAEALRVCIGTDAAYVGMIGSRHKVATLKKEFLSKSWATEEQWNDIHTPIGLGIGSKTVQEIAVSIAAQLILERSKKQGSYVR